MSWGGQRWPPWGRHVTDSIGGVGVSAELLWGAQPPRKLSSDKIVNPTKMVCHGLAGSRRPITVSANAKRNHTGSEKPKAVVVGCRLCPEHGDSVPHYLLDNDAYPVSICRCAFRLLGRHVGGSRHGVRLPGNPSPEPFCRHRTLVSHLRQLRTVFALPLAFPVHPSGDGSIDSHRYVGNGA